MTWIVRAGSAALVMWLCSSAAVAQPAFSPVISAGAAVAVNCLGYEEELPMPPVCGGTLYASAGPYLRPYLSIRPIDRLLVTAALGYVNSPRIETPLCCPLSGAFPRGVTVQQARTAWHGVFTGAYVTGRPTHPVRVFVGGGGLFFSDTIHIESTPREGPTTLVTNHDTGLAGVATTGALWRMGAHLEGRVSYMLARRMTAATTPDTSWRHEFAVGLGWRRGGGGGDSPNP
jgi:hypothetical protein